MITFDLRRIASCSACCERRASEPAPLEFLRRLDRMLKATESVRYVTKPDYSKMTIRPHMTEEEHLNSLIPYLVPWPRAEEKNET